MKNAMPIGGLPTDEGFTRGKARMSAIQFIKNPMIGLAKGMTLKSLIAMPQAKEYGITDEMVLKVLAEINGKSEQVRSERPLHSIS
jgi:hypothetical protein